MVAGTVAGSTKKIISPIGIDEISLDAHLNVDDVVLLFSPHP